MQTFKTGKIGERCIFLQNSQIKWHSAKNWCMSFILKVLILGIFLSGQILSSVPAWSETIPGLPVAATPAWQGKLFPVHR